MGGPGECLAARRGPDRLCRCVPMAPRTTSTGSIRSTSSPIRSLMLGGREIDATRDHAGVPRRTRCRNSAASRPMSPPAIMRSNSCSGGRISTAPGRAPATGPPPTTTSPTAPAAIATAAPHYLSAATELLVSDLEEMVGNWQDGGAARDGCHGESADGLRRDLHRHGLALLWRTRRRADEARPACCTIRRRSTTASPTTPTTRTTTTRSASRTSISAATCASTAASSKGPRLSDLVAAADPDVDAEMTRQLDDDDGSAMRRDEAARRDGRGLRPDDRARAMPKGNAVVQAAIDALVAQTGVDRTCHRRARSRRGRARRLGQPRQSGSRVRVAGPAVAAQARCRGSHRMKRPSRSQSRVCRRLPFAAARHRCRRWPAPMVDRPDLDRRRPRPHRGDRRADRRLLDAAEPFEANPGGATTTHERARPRRLLAALGQSRLRGRSRDFKVGNGVFRKLWVSAPSSTTASDGLGPLFNARGCQECHIKDGRGHPPEPGATDAVSLPCSAALPYAATRCRDPTYGHQLQDFAGAGPSSRRADVSHLYRDTVELAGGETVSLREPHYAVADLGYGPLAGDTDAVAARRAADDRPRPARSDPCRRHPRPGRPRRRRWRRHFRPRQLGHRPGDRRDALGRFGWKAIQPTIADQSGRSPSPAISALSTELIPAAHGDCTDAQADCLAAPVGADGSASSKVRSGLFDLVIFYSQQPRRAGAARLDDPRGAARQASLLRDRLHRLPHAEIRHLERSERADALRFQLIWPYTDMLLHDMGEGLADHRPEGGRRPRMAHRAALGYRPDRDRQRAHAFLHDGRARNLLEAILWHGGEAEAARDAVVAMPPEDRAALIRFLESL